MMMINVCPSLLCSTELGGLSGLAYDGETFYAAADRGVCRVSFF